MAENERTYGSLSLGYKDRGSTDSKSPTRLSRSGISRKERSA